MARDTTISKSDLDRQHLEDVASDFTKLMLPYITRLEVIPASRNRYIKIGVQDARFQIEDDGNTLAVHFTSMNDGDANEVKRRMASWKAPEPIEDGISYKEEESMGRTFSQLVAGEFSLLRIVEDGIVVYTCPLSPSDNNPFFVGVQDSRRTLKFFPR